MICSICGDEGEMSIDLKFNQILCKEHHRSLLLAESNYEKYKTVRNRILSKKTLDFIGRKKTREKTRKLIKEGLVKKQPCEICGNIAEIHHLDYKNPNEIKFLCKYHHREWHLNNK